MAREKLDYRDTYAELSKLFNGKMLLTATEVATAFKCDPRTVKKRYPFVKAKIELTRLASAMCLSDEDIRKAYKLI